MVHRENTPTLKTTGIQMLHFSITLQIQKVRLKHAYIIHHRTIDLQTDLNLHQQIIACYLAALGILLLSTLSKVCMVIGSESATDSARKRCR
uniref:Uncharacterized protein n=1 Tax=Arundo donax TaxID=35708 RepID=A0A0A9EJW0_ARUDO